MNNLEKEKILLIKKKTDILLEDLEVITISLSVIKDRFYQLLMEDGDQKAKEEIVSILEDSIKKLLEKQNQIKLILNQRIYEYIKNGQKL